MERVGIIPAAGFATRISPLPCSKEIYPIGFRNDKKGGKKRPRVACQSLLESMAIAATDKAYIIIRPEKWDIPAFLGSGKIVNLNIAYILTDRTLGVPFTVDRAFPFIKKKLILFGFSDIIFNPKDAFVRLVDHQKSSGADIVLGLFLAQQPSRADMVSIDPVGRAKDILVKPVFSTLKYAWVIAVWSEVFTNFIHKFLSRPSVIAAAKEKELYMGDVIRAWINQGLLAQTVIFKEGNYIDIGTPAGLSEAITGSL